MGMIREPESRKPYLTQLPTWPHSTFHGRVGVGRAGALLGDTLLRMAWIKGSSQCAQKELSVEWQVHDTI
jgi:hypothetical protein